jgi:hypothetical protein
MVDSNRGDMEGGGARREATRGGRGVPAQLRGGSAQREAAVGELQLDLGATTHGWERHGSCSNEGRQLRIRGVRRIIPDSDSVL